MLALTATIMPVSLTSTSWTVDELPSSKSGLYEGYLLFLEGAIRRKWA